MEFEESNLKYVKTPFAFILSMLTGYLFAALFVSLGNMASLSSMAVELPLAARIDMISKDFTGLIPAYLSLLAVALLLGFCFTGLLLSRWVKTSSLLYAFAGFVAVSTLHIVMRQVFGMSPIASTRTFIGLIAQGLVGALVGWLFYLLNNKVFARQ